MGNAGRKALAISSAPKFERPRNPISAFGMRVLNCGSGPYSAAHWAHPADCRRQLRRGMDRDTVGLHVARNSNVLIRRICDQIRSAAFTPAIDKGVTRTIGEHVSKVTFDFHRTR